MKILNLLTEEKVSHCCGRAAGAHGEDHGKCNECGEDCSYVSDDEFHGLKEGYDLYEDLDTALHNVASALVRIAVQEGGEPKYIKQSFISQIQDIQEQIRTKAGPMLVHEYKKASK